MLNYALRSLTIRLLSLVIRFFFRGNPEENFWRISPGDKHRFFCRIKKAAVRPDGSSAHRARLRCVVSRSVVVMRPEFWMIDRVPACSSGIGPQSYVEKPSVQTLCPPVRSLDCNLIAPASGAIACSRAAAAAGPSCGCR